MDLVHFSVEPIDALDTRAYTQETGAKPNGFWVSDESAEECWSGFFLYLEMNKDIYAYSVNLASDANVLILNTFPKLYRFIDLYEDPEVLDSGHIHTHIRWEAVAEEYQGVVISPYRESFSWRERVQWCEHWDAASGCIWDIDAIQALTLSPEALWWRTDKPSPNP